MIKIFQSFKFIWSFARMQISSGMMYRFAFWGSCFYNVIMSAMQILMFDAISKYGGVAGWSRYQLYIFAGTFMILNGLDFTFIGFGLRSIPDRIRTGTLDFAKTKPVSTLVFVTYGCPDVGTFLQVILGSIFVIYCAIKMQVLNVLSVLLYIAAIILMFFLIYSIKLILYSVSFWTVKASATHEIVSLMNNFANKLPSTAIKGIWKVILYVIFPVGLLSNLPSSAFLGMGGFRMWITAVLVTVVLYFVGVKLWKKGLKIYDSASS